MSSTTTTSFIRKKRTEGPQMPHGTRCSLQNSQLLVVSTGVPSLDHILGGGLPVGSLLLVEEDHFGNASKALLKYFLAEGVVSKHSLIVSTADSQPSQLIMQLPSVIEQEGKNSLGLNSQSSSDLENEALKIAWRYKDLPQVQSLPGTSQYGHYYDLSKPVNEEQLKECDIEMFDPLECDYEGNTSFLVDVTYEKLLFHICKKLKEEQFSMVSASSEKKKNVLRIAIQGIGSLFWNRQGNDHTSVTKFLHLLRALLRSSYSVAFVSFPSQLLDDNPAMQRIRNLADTVIRLESFEGANKEANPLFKDYSGLFHLIRLPRLNSLTHHIPETMNFVYKLKRRKFLIEKLHLPPELEENASRPQEDPVPDKRGKKHLSIGCTSSNPASTKFDF